MLEYWRLAMAPWNSDSKDADSNAASSQIPKGRTLGILLKKQSSRFKSLLRAVRKKELLKSRALMMLSVKQRRLFSELTRDV